MSKEILARIKQDAEKYAKEMEPHVSTDRSYIYEDYTAGAIAERPKVRAEVIDEIINKFYTEVMKPYPQSSTNPVMAIERIRKFILSLEQLKLKP